MIHRHCYFDAEEADAVAVILRDHFGFRAVVTATTVDEGATEFVVEAVEPAQYDGPLHLPSGHYIEDETAIDEAIHDGASHWDYEAEDRESARGRRRSE